VSGFRCQLIGEPRPEVRGQMSEFGMWNNEQSEPRTPYHATRNADTSFFRVLELGCFGEKRIAYLTEAMTRTDEVPFGILDFGHCNLFGFCYLEFVILIGLKRQRYL